MPIRRGNAAGLADQRRMIRRRVVRQALQMRHHVRMAERRVPRLAGHDALFRSRPHARHLPLAGLRQPRGDRSILTLEGAFPTPGTPSADDTETAEQARLKNWGRTLNPVQLLLGWFLVYFLCPPRPE